MDLNRLIRTPDKGFWNRHGIRYDWMEQLLLLWPTYRRWDERQWDAARAHYYLHIFDWS